MRKIYKRAKVFALSLLFGAVGFNTQAQFGCGSGVVITDGFTQSGITTPGNGGVEDWNTNPTGTSIDELYWDDDVYLFEYTSGSLVEEISMTIFSRNSWNGIGIFSTCTGTEFSGELDADGNISADVSTTVTATIPPSTTVYIAIGQWGSPNDLDFDVTDFTVTQIPCPDVTGITTDDLSATTADISWTAGLSETSWNIQWGAPGFTPGNSEEIGSSIVTTTPAYQITGLTEVTDYEIYIQADCAADGTSNWVGPYAITTEAICPIVSNITQDAIDYTTADISWTPGGTEASWSIEWGAPGFTPGNSEEIGADISASPNYQITGLTAGTGYEIYIQADCDTDGTSQWAGPFSIYTGYCVPTFTYTGDYTSSFVTIDAISNVSYSASSQPAGGYEDLSAGSPIVSQADSTFNFTTAYVGGSNTFRIWVDWNNDFTFDDAEEVYLNSVSGATQSGSITIPNGTVSGDYRMRIRSRYSTTVPGACSNETYGSVIDYTLRIIDPLVAPSLTQAGGTPDCNTGTDLDATGTPDADIEWYWQTDADGTAMSNQYSGPYTVFANGTYYLRAYHTIYDFWSAASSIDVTNLPLAPTPPAPTAAQNPVCVPGTDISMPAPPADVTYYWQTVVDGVSTDSPADTPWNITETGTYYVSAFESTSGCWSATSEITVTVDNQIPLAPLVTQDTYNICTGATSQIIEATAPASGQINETSGDININIPDNNTTGISSDLTVSGIPTGVTVDELFVTINIQHTFNGDLDIYLVGANGTEIELSTDNGGLGDNYVNTVFSLNGTNPITGATAPMTGTFSAEGDMSTLVTGLLNGTWTLKVIDDAGGDLGVLRNWSIEIQYSAPVATIEWFDAATGGNSLGTNNTLETVGTSVLSNPATVGSYNFYASSVAGACGSDERTLVTINVDNVNVLVSPIDATCNGGEDGSFEITSIECGVEPLTYSVNGGAFGPIPTNLVAGTYTIVAQDDNGDVSSDVTITIAEPDAITDFSAEAIAFDQVELTWTTTGLEGEWIVEYGEAGFTPGTGTFVTVTNNPAVIDQLDENTEYDFYIQPSCAPGTSGEQVGAASAVTFCTPIAAAGWCEGFETDSPTLDCWTVLNENEDDNEWTLYTGYANSGTYSAGLYTDYNGGNNDDWLITPQVTLTGNEVLSFFYRVRSSSEPNDFRVLLSTTGKNPADFDQVLMDLSSYNNTTYEDTLINLSAYTGNVFIAFHVPSGGLDGYYLYIDDVCIDICTPQASQDGELDVCSLDETIDLNTIITPGETTGTWSFDVNPSALNGSTLTVDALPAGTYQAMYTVQTFCPAEADTAYATINLYGRSSAGNNSSVATCNYGPFNLFDGLTGSVDLGGTWYDPSNTALPGAIVTFNGQIAANYNYYYVVSNGVCPADTAYVEIQLQDCASIAENELAGFALYPNPTSDVVNIQYSGAAINTEVILSDSKGSVILNEKVNFKTEDNYEIDMTNLVKGVYFLNIYSESGSKVIRVVRN
ncbi:hypothetical protein GCM10009118_31580 [Wandonia haliotis]|uniref:T9SS type A sorting domain-containing protein n=1 Tax=Wandonia haliotis TaxID=574963 RepID=A0ABN1MTS2_9FLAO